MGDTDSGDTGTDGRKGILQLRNHTAGDGAVSHEGFEALFRDLGNQAGGVCGVAHDTGEFEAVGKGGFRRNRA